MPVEVVTTYICDGCKKPEIGEQFPLGWFYYGISGQPAQNLLCSLSCAVMHFVHMLATQAEEVLQNGGVDVQEEEVSVEEELRVSREEGVSYP